MSQHHHRCWLRDDSTQQSACCSKLTSQRTQPSCRPNTRVSPCYRPNTPAPPVEPNHHNILTPLRPLPPRQMHRAIYFVQWARNGSKRLPVSSKLLRPQRPSGWMWEGCFVPRLRFPRVARLCVRAHSRQHPNLNPSRIPIPNPICDDPTLTNLTLTLEGNRMLQEGARAG